MSISHNDFEPILPDEKRPISEITRFDEYATHTGNSTMTTPPAVNPLIAIAEEMENQARIIEKNGKEIPYLTDPIICQKWAFNLRAYAARIRGAVGEAGQKYGIAIRDKEVVAVDLNTGKKVPVVDKGPWPTPKEPGWYWRWCTGTQWIPSEIDGVDVRGKWITGETWGPRLTPPPPPATEPKVERVSEERLDRMDQHINQIGGDDGVHMLVNRNELKHLIAEIRAGRRGK